MPAKSLPQHAGQKRKRHGEIPHQASGNEDHTANGKTPATTTTYGAERKERTQPTATQLPIHNHASNIANTVKTKPITLLTGATGSGKSTQLPQILLRHFPPGTRIAITQPRRVAAISLAKRVASEMDSPPLGHPHSKVGYSVRFDQKVGSKCQIKFLTEGTLLNEVLADGTLGEYDVVVVDEVHERSVNVDVLLGLLRNIVQGGKERKGKGPLKLVVMSATADLDELSTFFNNGWTQLSTPRLPIEAASGAAADAAPLDQSVSSGKKRRRKKNARDLDSQENNVTHNEHIEDVMRDEEQVEPHSDSAISQHVGIVRVEGRQYPVSVTYLTEATPDFPETSVKTIFEIHYREPLPGDILVFLTGQDVVESVESLVKEYASVMDAALPRLHVLPLFASLPPAAQQEVFEPTPAGHRKVVLATNIAETSVTIPGVRYVVDCGLAKVKEFYSQLGMDTLLVKEISKSSAIQRTGRAGREAPGKAYRLYTNTDYEKLAETTTPEILRCDLSSAILALKARGITDVSSFPFLTPPRTGKLRKALLQLYYLGALREDDGHISDTGRKMAQMPLSPALARVLLWSARGGAACVLSVVDIISCLSVENIFLHVTSEERKEKAETKRRQLYRREGDHLTLLATVSAYAEASDRKAWCRDHFVSWQAMRNVMNVQKQLRELCTRQGLLAKGTKMEAVGGAEAVAREPELGVEIRKSFIKGFIGNVARLMPDGSYKTVEGNQTVAIHPSSVLFGRKVEAIVYNELVYTMKSYARGVSAIQFAWWGDAATREEQDA